MHYFRQWDYHSVSISTKVKQFSFVLIRQFLSERLHRRVISNIVFKLQLQSLCTPSTTQLKRSLLQISKIKRRRVREILNKPFELFSRGYSFIKPPCESIFLVGSSLSLKEKDSLSVASVISLSSLTDFPG